MSYDTEVAQLAALTLLVAVALITTVAALWAADVAAKILRGVLKHFLKHWFK